MDDEIIYSWCFNDVECFDSTPSAAIIILDKDLESFLSFRSQQRAHGEGQHQQVDEISFEDVGAINLFDDQDIDTCIEEVMTVNEGADFEELPLDEPTGELKPLPSTLKYAFLDFQLVEPVIISSQLNEEQEKRLLDAL